MPKLPTLLASLFLQLFVGFAYAQNLDGKHLDWYFFSSGEENNKICYVVAMPIKRMSDVQVRGESYFIITKSKDNFAEVSLASGYMFKNNSDVELSFGLRKFNLISYKSQAWSYGIDDDFEIIKAMKNSDEFTVNSVSDNNQISQDVYSLIGFNKAYDQMLEKCSSN